MRSFDVPWLYLHQLLQTHIVADRRSRETNSPFGKSPMTTQAGALIDMQKQLFGSSE
jgi:hypothetical protein